MSDLYFVQVIAEDGAVSRWEALDKTQADFVYNEQVIIYGAENCTIGKSMDVYKPLKVLKRVL
jgi:hypothetical protein